MHSAGAALPLCGGTELEIEVVVLAWINPLVVFWLGRVSYKLLLRKAQSYFQDKKIQPKKNQISNSHWPLTLALVSNTTAEQSAAAGDQENIKGWIGKVFWPDIGTIDSNKCGCVIIKERNMIIGQTVVPQLIFKYYTILP